MSTNKFASKQAVKKLTAVPELEYEIEAFQNVEDNQFDFYIIWPMSLDDRMVFDDMIVKDVVYKFLVDPETKEPLLTDGMEIDNVWYMPPIVRAIAKELKNSQGKR